jgi:aryl-phospho-beta-D-glucosidase BglC (GH1 family)
MAADTANGGLQQLEEHYQTFIVRLNCCEKLRITLNFVLQTEKDFADIAAAGLNWVRLPIPFWAVDKWNNEPFLEKVCWKYVFYIPS